MSLCRLIINKKLPPSIQEFISPQYFMKRTKAVFFMKHILSLLSTSQRKIMKQPRRPQQLCLLLEKTIQSRYYCHAYIPWIFITECWRLQTVLFLMIISRLGHNIISLPFFVWICTNTQFSNMAFLDLKMQINKKQIKVFTCYTI